MRNVIGLIVGFYLTVALVVFVCAAWSFSTDDRWKGNLCTSPGALVRPVVNEPALDGGFNWLPWAAYRAIAWPKAYMDDAPKVRELGDWLFVQYNPFLENCR